MKFSAQYKVFPWPQGFFQSLHLALQAESSHVKLITLPAEGFSVLSHFSYPFTKKTSSDTSTAPHTPTDGEESFGFGLKAHGRC